MVIATNEMTAIIKAIKGNAGYAGTLNGRSNPGSVFLSLSNEIIDTMYNVSAPNTEMVIISEVLPVSNAMIPTTIFNNKALEGV